MNQNLEPTSEIPLIGQAVEEWINKVLKIDESEQQVVPRRDKYSKGSMHIPASQTYGIDLMTLQSHGISQDNAKKVQRSLYVHSVGLH